MYNDPPDNGSALPRPLRWAVVAVMLILLAYLVGAIVLGGRRCGQTCDNSKGPVPTVEYR